MIIQLRRALTNGLEAIDDDQEPRWACTHRLAIAVSVGTASCD
jgi:hypothetical protein